MEELDPLKKIKATSINAHVNKACFIKLYFYI